MPPQEGIMFSACLSVRPSVRPASFLGTGEAYNDATWWRGGMGDSYGGVQFWAQNMQIKVANLHNLCKNC